MNKKLVLFCLFICLHIVLILSFAGCSINSIMPGIEYNDGEKNVTLPVKYNSNYSLEVVPLRKGYIFKGLFDSEDCTHQVVNEEGQSIEPYKQVGKTKLYVKWEPIKIEMQLHYDNYYSSKYPSSVVVEYDSKLPSLPCITPNREHDYFYGWYTSDNLRGRQVTDCYGNPMDVPVNDDNFCIDFNDNSSSVFVGISGEPIDTFLFLNGGFRNVKVPYGSSIDVLTSSQYLDNNLVVTVWSTDPNDMSNENIFRECITAPIRLYPVQRRPYVRLNDEKGNLLRIIWGMEGETVNLYNINYNGRTSVGWKDKSGKVIESIVMPKVCTDVFAYWSIEAKHTREERYHIYDDATKNPYDVINIESLVGYSVQQLRDMGYKKVHLSGSFYRVENNDGYQTFYIDGGTPTYNCYYELTDLENEHNAVGKFPIKEPFEVDINLGAIADNKIYFHYGAHGFAWNDWFCDDFSVNVSVR